MTTSLPIPIAYLHPPEEFLVISKILFNSDNPKMLRAAVLEAITALEAFVHVTVFGSLEN